MSAGSNDGRDRDSARCSLPVLTLIVFEVGDQCIDIGCLELGAKPGFVPEEGRDIGAAAGLSQVPSEPAPGVIVRQLAPVRLCIYQAAMQCSRSFRAPSQPTPQNVMEPHRPALQINPQQGRCRNLDRGFFCVELV